MTPHNSPPPSAPHRLATRPLRVAQVLGSLEFGGMQTLVLELMRGLDRARFDPILFYFKAPNHFEDEIRERGWRCRKVSMSRTFRPGEVRGLARALREEGVGLVHAHADFANFAARAAALLLPEPVPLIAHYHGHYSHHMDDAFRAREALLAPYTDRIIACSESVERLLLETLRVPPGPVRRIVNGLNLDPFETAGRRRQEAREKFGIPPGVFHIIHTGRLEPHKAPERLLHALCGLDGRGSAVAATAGGEGGGVAAAPTPVWRATFVGGGGQEEELKALLGRLRLGSGGETPLAERVRFAGWSREIPQHLASADLFVLCSKHEGLPLSLVESLAAGTPVIASDIPGTREVVVDGESGLLVDMEDPKRLVEALRRLMTDDALRARLAEGGRRRARDFSIGRFIGEIQAVYGDLSSMPRPKPDAPRGLFNRWRFLRAIHKAGGGGKN